MTVEARQRGNYFVLGAIVGVALGIVLALLFAPRRGEETRAILKEKGIELQKQAQKVSRPTQAGLEGMKDEQREGG